MAEEQSEVKKNKIQDFTTKMRQNPWIVSTIVLGAVVLIFFYLSFSGVTGNVVKGDTAGNNLADYLNSKTGGGVEYVSSRDLGGLYQVTVSYQGQEIPVYTSKDGKYFAQSAILITGNAVSDDSETTQETPQEVPKSDKPKVELFVMTHCPYGTQAEKGIIPALKLLGDKIDSKIRFVHYFMHGDKEETETYNQLCIREEQSAKYLDYLSCFLEDGDSERCLIKTGIDKSKLNACLASEAKEYYAEDKQLSNQYDVQGSPTLIINRAESSAGRSSSSYLAGICAAFNTPASECSQTLSSASPSPGFGSAADTAGHPSTDTQCA